MCLVYAGLRFSSFANSGKQMATYLADRVIVFDGQPSVDARANTPESLLTGCNKFLKNLDVT